MIELTFYSESDTIKTDSNGNKALICICPKVMLLKVVMVLIRDHGWNGQSLVRVPGRVEEALALNIGNAKMGLSV